MREKKKRINKRSASTVKKIYIPYYYFVLHLTCFTLRDKMKPTISRNIDFIQFIYEHTNVHFWMWRWHGPISICWLLCEKSASNSNNNLRLSLRRACVCVLFPYLDIYNGHEEKLFGSSWFCFVEIWHRKLYFMVQPSRKNMKKLLIKALR